MRTDRVSAGRFLKRGLAAVCVLLALACAGCSLLPDGKPWIAEQTAGAERAAAAENTYAFRSEEKLEAHYQKHGGEFGGITRQEYLDMANDLIRRGDEVETKTDEDGDTLFYDIEKNQFLVLARDGYIRTFFRPDDGIGYWNRQ